ncbi:CDP-alcohol phosphatidyltransferase family protein [Bacteroidales bacterium OttesenSCG-928-M11]|nr:CDP-alcohol phosphatidyltransferase family protein [Bacteroidales bacterium OttesenSCG-928-M11]
MQEKTKPTLADSLKSADTEEWIDIHFYRPMGFRWALFFDKIGVSPNQITIASIFIGIGAGICFYFTDFWINLLGVFLLIWANTYDSADGQLARMTGKKSEMGRILDGACGDIWFITIYLAIVFRLWDQWDYWILILALAAGYSHSLQASMADYFRNLHLFFLKGKSGSEFHNSKDLAEKLKQISWKNPAVKIFEIFYLNYTRQQERFSPRTQKMMEVIKTRKNGNVSERFRDEFRMKSLRYINMTNLLSFNLRAIVLFISVLIGFPWIYFAFELTVMNIMLIYMVNRYERICRKFTGGLTA